MLEKGSTSATEPRRRGFFLRSLVVFVFTFFLIGGPVLAQTNTASQNLQTIGSTAGVTTSLPDLIGRIIYILLGTLGVVFLGILLYAGYLWMTAGGEEKKTAEAKNWIKNAVIGLIIIASAFAITNFIMSQLQAVIEGGGVSGVAPGGVGFPSAAGSLGGGIIEFHAPPRDATDVPRNTAIAITFKEPIKLASFVKDYNDNGTPANLADDIASSTHVWLNSDAVRIYPSGHPDQALQSQQAKTRFTTDRKTFVMKPVNYLGSASQNVKYTVELLPGSAGILREDGKPAFSGSFSSGYKWEFTVSTVIDLTPPHIVSVIPSAGGLYAPNIVVQVNFSEMIDPTSASGIFKKDAGFTNAEVSAVPIADPTAAPVRPNGEFKISNRYTTMEFVTDLVCGVNSCGNKIFCLPSDSTVSVVVHAATLSTQPPQADVTANGYDGITDLAGNSLDGDGNGIAQGRGKDDYLPPPAVWSFGTGSKPNLIPPKITAVLPKIGAQDSPQGSSNIPAKQEPHADFDSPLQASTILSDNVFIRTSETAKYADTFWWTPWQQLLTADGRVASSTEAVVNGRVGIAHREYAAADPKKPPPPEYYPFLESDLQNVYQNCFIPAQSAACQGPTCCNDVASNQACKYPVTP